jgi:Flp pilus assembly pilin Flp
MNSHRSPKKNRSPGQAMIEVLLILVLVVIAFGTGPNNPLQQLGDAIRTRFAAYTESISRP